MNSEWREVTLEDVATVIMGQSPPGSSYNQDGLGLPFMQGSAEFGIHHPKPVKFTTAPAKVAKVGDILVSVRAPVGDTNFADREIAIGRGLGIVRANPENETRFLRLMLQLQVGRLISVSGSGMFSSITGANLKGVKFAVPPLNVQRRIVDVVEHVDAVIQTATDAMEKSRTARAALLINLLSRETNPFIDSQQQDLNSEWLSVSLSEVVAIQKGKTPPFKNENGEGRPYCSADYLRTRQPTLWVQDYLGMVESSESDLIILWDGAGAGDIFSGLDGIVSSTMAVIKPLDELTLNRNFLRYSIELRSTEIKNACRGTTVPHVNPEHLKSLEISLPPLDVQQRIVDVIEDVDRVIAHQSDVIEKARATRSAILADLLSGNHEIPDSYNRFLEAG